MDENYGQSPNSVTRRHRREGKDFPVSDTGGDTMVERAMRSATKMRGASQPGADEADPKSTTVKRTQFTKPARPGTATASKGMKDMSPEEQRGQSISQALLKGAAMVPESRFSGTLRGLLGGASVGLDIGTALEQYRRMKRDETAANAAMRMSGEAE